MLHNNLDIFIALMGGGESHHYHTTTVYQDSPATTQLLEQQTSQLKAFEEEAIKREDPKFYKENAEALLCKFVEKLTTLELTDLIDKQSGERHVGFFGQISCGKTTMINVLFNKEYSTALGHCTAKCEVVHTDNGLVVWDLPGQNDDYRFYNAENLSFVKSLDKCVILFDNDISVISNILRVIHKINPKSMIVVRTKVDQHNHYNVRTIEEEKKLDREKIKELLSDDIETYCVSSINIRKSIGSRYDWDEVFKLITE